MIVLGVGGLLHDPSVGLIDDKRVLAAVESDKVTRHHREISALPTEAISLVLSRSGLGLREVDFIVTNWDARPLSNGMYLSHLAKFLRHGISPWRSIGVVASIAASHTRSAFKLQLRSPYVPPIRHVHHHLAHVGASYTLSPFDNAAVAIIDGAGELDCTSLFQCEGHKVKKINGQGLPLDSLGNVFAMGTQHLGFRMLADEYKVMALAAFGSANRKYESFFAKLVEVRDDGNYRINRWLLGDFLKNSYFFPQAALELIGPPRPSDAPLRQEHMDFARAMQNRIGDAVLNILTKLQSRTRSENLCLGGGVALNSVINGRVVRETAFKNVFIPPAPHDAGTALGAAAYFLCHELKAGRPAALTNAYLGPAYGDEEVRDVLGSAGVPYVKLDDPSREGARLIANGELLGWFQGAAEFGPRALGNRSILADPRDENMRVRVSELVKGREPFRPVAPAILEEYYSQYFPSVPNSPFMSFVHSIPEGLRKQVAAVVHVDGTARPQSVSAMHNPRFHSLISAFREMTGVPLVINTSLNVAGEPIALSPRDAVRTFYASGLSALIINSFLIRKSG
jgi:carbamoyltransferase